MSTMIDREGIFRGIIGEYGLSERDSGAVALTLKAKLEEIWNPESQTWEDWKSYDVEASGDLWIVKKDGQLNRGQIESLCRHAGWDGNMTALVNGEWTPHRCQFSIKRDEYEGKIRFRISFINDHDRTPGQLGNIDEAKAKALQSRFGGDLRAIAGNIKRNGPAPMSAPSIPPVPRFQRPQVPAQTIATSRDEEIPFAWLGFAVALTSAFFSMV